MYFLTLESHLLLLFHGSSPHVPRFITVALQGMIITGNDHST